MSDKNIPYKERLDKAIQKVFDELMNMSQEEFDELIEKHLTDDRTTAIFRAMNLDYQGSDDETLDW